MTTKNADRCARCGHPASWHRCDDADPKNGGSPGTWVFRCLGYDCEVDGPVPAEGRACDCPDFVSAEPRTEETT